MYIPNSMGCGASTEFDPSKETHDEFMARRMYETYVKMNSVEQRYYSLHANMGNGRGGG